MLLDHLTDSQWRTIVERSVPQETLDALSHFLEMSLQKEKVYPVERHWFRALNELPLEQVKVVILGQDPYHGAGQAQGLSFSVPSHQKLPPSLRNIFKELADDCQIENKNGDLSAWVAQGVLLLNATLTVAESRPGSHQKQGWELVTDAILTAIAERESPCVFLLWGAFAQSKCQLITQPQHLVLTAAHPSPLSAHRGWFGCQHFSKTNAFLRANQIGAIDWRTESVEQTQLEF